MTASIDRDAAPGGEPRVAVIGAGELGRTLIGGWLDAGAVAAESIFATAGHRERIAAVSERFGIEGAVDNRRAAEFGDIVLLAVKPQTADEVLQEIGDLLHPGQVLVSILASVRTSYIENRVPAEVPVVRALPTTPSRVAA